MLCACSGERFKLERPQHSPEPQSPDSLATRDFSASGLSSRAGEWDSKFEDAQVDEVESTLKEALSLNYEEARALLGRLEYQRGNYDAALQVFQGIDIRGLTPKIAQAIVERTRKRKQHSKADMVPPSVMSMHSVSLLLEAILLKAKSLEGLGQFTEAAKECKVVVDTVESALPNGMPEGIGEDCKLLEMFHTALQLLPELWIEAGLIVEAITAYRRALVKPWNFSPQKLAGVQKDLASMLLYGGVEANLLPELQICGPTSTKTNIEEAILLLLMLMKRIASQEINWDVEIMDHLTYALSLCGQYELLADHVEEALPGTYTRSARWYSLALCYSASGQNETALNLIRKVSGSSEGKHKPYFPALLLGAQLCSQYPDYAQEGINFARKWMDLADRRNEHFIGQAHKLLGVCYGTAARVSVSDSVRMLFWKESLNSLNSASVDAKEDAELVFCVGLENAVQRNLDAALENAMAYSNSMAGSSGKGWVLLALIVSAKQQYKDAETIVDFGLDEAGGKDHLELLRLKAVLQIAQEQPKQAIETFRILLSVIKAKKIDRADSEVSTKQRPLSVNSGISLETACWQDLATIYTKLGSWTDAETCMDKAKSIDFYSPRSWHTTGLFFEAQLLYKEALISFSISLSIEPDYVPSMIASAEVLMRFGSQSHPIASSLLRNALRLEPTNHDAWLNLGLLSKMEGLVEQAADFFQAAYELKQSAPVQSFL